MTTAPHEGLLQIERLLREWDNEAYSRYQVVKSVLLSQEYSFTMSQFPGGNDHGPEHIKRVLEYLDLLARDGLVQRQEQVGDLFVAMLSVLYHDIGMLKGRKDHAKNGALLVEFDKTSDLLPPFFAKFVGKAISAHSSESNIDEMCAEFNQTEKLGRYMVRPRLVAALVRLADELDEDHRRAPEHIASQLDLPADSKIYWRFNARVQGVRPTRGENAIWFEIAFRAEDFHPVDGENQSLVEFALKKILKINNERIHCNAHLTETLRWSSIMMSLKPLSGAKPPTNKPKNIWIDDGMTLESLLQHAGVQSRPQ